MAGALLSWLAEEVITYPAKVSISDVAGFSLATARISSICFMLYIISLLILIASKNNTQCRIIGRSQANQRTETRRLSHTG
jgi:hypothetical protein